MTKEEIANKVQDIVMSHMVYVDDSVIHKDEMIETGDIDHFESYYNEMADAAIENGGEIPDSFEFSGDCDNAALTAMDLLVFRYKQDPMDVANAIVYLLEDGKIGGGHMVTLLRTDDKKDAYVIDINLIRYLDGYKNTIGSYDFKGMVKNKAIEPIVVMLSDIQKDEGLTIKNDSRFLDTKYQFVVEKIIDGFGNVVNAYEEEVAGWDFVKFYKKEE